MKDICYDIEIWGLSRRFVQGALTEAQILMMVQRLVFREKSLNKSQREACLTISDASES